ncbi:hypothetical protein HanOQP8_Chr14g0509091 [Helianthus annuus]|nr:hypothetical protein HanHA89_Chr14g0541621 [Helianthus annuus]KAJ0636566.1 hypothetical protein HanOQP8_Chr17g0663371 [Helianthus annuus]KAJ0658516.1 hypothetical protein HanOQP8_Chr14g0509091 [Helianthus annuus]
MQIGTTKIATPTQQTKITPDQICRQPPRLSSSNSYQSKISFSYHNYRAIIKCEHIYCWIEPWRSTNRTTTLAATT